MEIGNIKIRANNTYPEITNATNSIRVVTILKDLLSSREGAVKDFLQHFYQSRIARQSDIEISELLEEIAIVEMEHSELLIDAIISFGGTPKYEDGKGRTFNSNYINYSTKLKDILDINIKNKQQSIKNYLNAHQMITNQSLKDLINRIIEDEQLHLNVFKNLLNTVSFLSI